MTKKSLDGQVAVVTGAARGIGLGIAQRLSAAGAKVAVWDLHPLPSPSWGEAGGGGKPNANRSAIPPSPSTSFTPALVRRVDVTDLADVEAAANETIAGLGRIDILVNNAGVNGPTVPVWDYPPEAWARVLAVDLTGVFNTCRTLAPHMSANGYGRIVNIASIAGKEGNPNNSAYSAAKHGVIGFTKSLAAELATTGVTANAVAPVITETELFKEMTEEYIAGRKARIPMGRFCTIEEIADMVAWVASPECSFTTGATFDISGGRATY